VQRLPSFQNAYTCISKQPFCCIARSPVAASSNSIVPICHRHPSASLSVCLSVCLCVCLHSSLPAVLGLWGHISLQVLRCFSPSLFFSLSHSFFMHNSFSISRAPSSCACVYVDLLSVRVKSLGRGVFVLALEPIFRLAESASLDS